MSTGYDKQDIVKLFGLPLFDLLAQAHQVYRDNFPANEIELCTLMSIKTGGCPEDCAYCPQSAHYKTGSRKEALFDVDAVVKQAQIAKQRGAKRFCMGAAWRSPPKKGFEQVLEIVKAVKALGLQTCVTLGMLNKEHAEKLKESGLDYYNHNLDSSPEFYKKIITTRTYQDRLDTIANVSGSGIKVCCGGIIGMGETREDRIEFLNQIIRLPVPPESVPINKLALVPGTPLGENLEVIDNFEFIRTVAVARVILPKSAIRLSAGRDTMSDEMQAFCFFAGVNSIHYGDDKLFITNNPGYLKDLELLDKLDIKVKKQI